MNRVRSLDRRRGGLTPVNPIGAVLNHRTGFGAAHRVTAGLRDAVGIARAGINVECNRRYRRRCCITNVIHYGKRGTERWEVVAGEILHRHCVVTRSRASVADGHRLAGTNRIGIIQRQHHSHTIDVGSGDRYRLAVDEHHEGAGGGRASAQHLAKRQHDLRAVAVCARRN